MNYDDLYTRTPLNRSAATVTSQKGCEVDSKQTILQQIEDLNKKHDYLVEIISKRKPGEPKDKALGTEIFSLNTKIRNLKKEAGISKYSGKDLGNYILDLVKADITRPQWDIYVAKAKKNMAANNE